ncbi:MAG: hypothetical protein K2W82_17810 [Candidatus Obscuribacterales bacterium]|nr:hypothetical protein [Candidatus Obscuribacterales bacterium]
MTKSLTKDLHQTLKNLDIFSEGHGPSGGHPVQMEGRLKTGEWIDFRARGTSCGLNVYEYDGEGFGYKIVQYSIGVEILPRSARIAKEELNSLPKEDAPYKTKSRDGVSNMRQAVAAKLIKRWLAEYQTHRQALLNRLYS